MKVLTIKDRNDVLSSIIDLLDKNRYHILLENQKDIDNLVENNSGFYDRLVLDDHKIDEMILALKSVIAQKDPIGQKLEDNILPNGLRVINQTVPFGTIFIIYESRPDVTIEATALAFKSGNRILLKGGKEAIFTNRILVSFWKNALEVHGIDLNWITILEFNREQTRQFLQQNKDIDIVVPRGGESLISFVQQYAHCPVIVSGRGNNFAYVANDADWKKVEKVVLNAKTQKVSACNALDKILIDRQTPLIEKKLNSLFTLLLKNKVKIEIDDRISIPIDGITKIKSERIWQEEFLSLRIAIGVVENLECAVDMINKNGGGHSSIIFTENEVKALEFMNAVDCAVVYHNASTRFTDGGQLGIGAELAISTDKLHHRGPLGLSHLVTNKYLVFGKGQIRE